MAAAPSCQSQSLVPFYPHHHHHPSSIHLLDQRIDILLPIPQIAALDEMLELPRPEAAVGIAQLERPEEIAGLLEVGPHRHDLVHQVLHADHPVLAQVLLDERVVRQRDALLLDLAVAALVDEVAHRFRGRVPVRDVGLDDLEHLGRRLGETDEDAVVDLEQAQQLEDLAGFGGDFVDTGCRLLVS